MQKTTWTDPYAGFDYEEDLIEVTAAFQAEKLSACGIDPAVFGAHVDPAFFIALAIHAGIKSGISAEGNINMVQRLTQHRPAVLGEPLSVKGQITEVNPVPRGRTLHTHVTFADRNGKVVITATRVSLKPDPQKVGVRGAGEKKPPLVNELDGWVQAGCYELTPTRVKSYSSEGNSIHYEEAAAQKAGFRAPLFGGGMGVLFLTATLGQQQPPQTFAAEIYFRRPIFWDEAVTVYADRLPNPALLALLKPDGKVGTELALSNLT